LLLRAPVIGRLSRSFATAQVVRVLGVLLEGRVPMLEALKLTRAATGRAAYAALVGRAEEAVTRGESVCGAFGDATLISPTVHEAIRSGERTGQIASVLMQVADHLDEDNEMTLKTVVSLVEPLILIVMGLVVGVMAISMFLPLFDLAASGGRH
jgi:type IV pilus assembly protein PilC